METIQQSLEQMMEHFNTRMAAFQDNLEKASAAPVTLASLATDFSQFKSLIGDSLLNLQHQVQVLAQQQDRLEMHSRRKILLLHGIPEDSDINLTLNVSKMFAEKLKVNIPLHSIRRIHRMGRVTGGKPRPVLVKFHGIEERHKVWIAKTGFKSSGITLSEFLTKVRHDAFMIARKHFGISKCWTQNGAVMIVGSDGKKHQVSSVAEVNRLINLTQSVTSDNTTFPATTQPAIAPKTLDTAGVTRSKRVLKK
ncbi:uncharacterized protein LOC131841741 [Achroia grisella]|uniref:uncharacterized protein LOC131841741 n=1 Tax=Achroia grisella TaxID=688607 RepID=UPI0027D2FE0F|nr:uncharacterized protein LOC131841741 [Achroia grisella]